MRRIDDMGNDLDTNGVYIVKRALIGTGWCCAPRSMTLEEVQKAVDEQCEPYIPAMCGEGPTPWTVTPREHSDPQLVSPGFCKEHPDRQHWFMFGGMSGVMLFGLISEVEGFPEDLKIRAEVE